MMRQSVRRELLLVLAVAVAILMIPAMMAAIGVRTPGIEEAHAGGALDVSIHRANDDGTIYNGEEIYVNASDLAAAYGMSEAEFMNMVDNGEITVSFTRSLYAKDDTACTNRIDYQALDTSYSTSAFRVTVYPGDCPNDDYFTCYQIETTGRDDTAYNNMGKLHKIVDRFEKKTTISTSFYQSCTATEAKINLTLDQLGEYKQYGSSLTVTAYDTRYRFFDKDNNQLATFTDSSMYPPQMSVPIKYGMEKLLVAVYSVVNGQEYFAGSWWLPITMPTIPKNKVYATRISANKAIIRWSGSSGASGYYVYMGNKKVKTVGAFTNKVTIAKKGAGKAKYKVIPYVESGGSTIKGTSNAMKAKANVMSRSVSTNYKNYDYGKGQVILKKISGSGKKYTITCYAINNRMFKLQKYKKIKITVYADGKKLFSKTIKNKKVNVKKYGTKKFSFKAKGKEGDLKHGSVTWSISYTPYWGKGITVF